jgi:hypothetical protein
MSKTLRKFDKACLTPVRNFRPAEIRARPDHRSSFSHSSRKRGYRPSLRSVISAMCRRQVGDEVLWQDRRHAAGEPPPQARRPIVVLNSMTAALEPLASPVEAR